VSSSAVATAAWSPIGRADVIGDLVAVGFNAICAVLKVGFELSPNRTAETEDIDIDGLENMETNHHVSLELETTNKNKQSDKLIYITLRSNGNIIHHISKNNIDFENDYGPPISTQYLVKRWVI